MNFKRQKPKFKDWSKWSIPRWVLISLPKNDLPDEEKYIASKKPGYCKRLKGKHVAGEWEPNRKWFWTNNAPSIRKCTGCGKVLDYKFPDGIFKH